MQFKYNKIIDLIRILSGSSGRLIFQETSAFHSDIILDAVIIVAMVIYLIIHLKEYLANIETMHNIEN